MCFIVISVDINYALVLLLYMYICILEMQNQKSESVPDIEIVVYRGVLYSIFVFFSPLSPTMFQEQLVHNITLGLEMTTSFSVKTIFTSQ